jgi:hypothetical protein
VAIGVNSEGYREILGICEGAKEDKSGWSGFLRHLVDRGLKGVELIVSDACRGLVECIGEYLLVARWQRCAVHFYRNVFSRVPATKVRDVAPTAAVEPEPASEIDPEVQRILVRAAAALGGPQGGKDVLDAASSVRFEYDRALEGGLEAHHVFVRRGADQALSVRIEGGDGIDSETRVLGDQAWLRTGRDGNFVVQDAQRGAELMSRASPVGVLPLVLTLADAIEGRPELRMMSHRGSATVEGEACDVLVFAGDRTSGPMSFEIGQSKGLVRRVSFEDGVVHQFDDYFAPATGLQIPRTIRTWRDGKLLETTRITALDLNGSLPESMLETP